MDPSNDKMRTLFQTHQDEMPEGFKSTPQAQKKEQLKQNDDERTHQMNETSVIGNPIHEAETDNADMSIKINGIISPK